MIATTTNTNAATTDTEQGAETVDGKSPAVRTGASLKVPVEVGEEEDNEEEEVGESKSTLDLSADRLG